MMDYPPPHKAEATAEMLGFGVIDYLIYMGVDVSSTTYEQDCLNARRIREENPESWMAYRVRKRVLGVGDKR